MKRRLPKGVMWALDGSISKETLHRWVSRAKRATHKRERREGRREGQRQAREG